MVHAAKNGPADAAGAGDHDATVPAGMSANACCACIIRYEDSPKRMRIPPHLLVSDGFARSSQGKAGDDPSLAVLKSCFPQGPLGSFMDGRKALLYPEPDVRRSGFAVPEGHPFQIGKARTTACSTTVDAQEQNIVRHEPFSVHPCQRELRKVWCVHWGGKDGRTMETERPSPRFADIDVWEPADILDALIGGQFSAVAAVRSVLPQMALAVRAMEDRLRREGRLIYVGAGTSGRLAVQDGAELMPTFGWPRDRLLLLIAGGEVAMIRAVEGAEDEVEHAVVQVQQHAVVHEDVMIAVAASGTTPFTLSCLREAKRRGALTIAIANNFGTPLLTEADHAIFLDTGAEPIAGSTRMNAGTAQRVALSLLSTLLMIRLGRVYRGVMVDVQASNRKLAQRKKEMLIYLTGAREAEAQDALLRASGSVKLAVLLLKGMDLDTACKALEFTGGRLREALQRV